MHKMNLKDFAGVEVVRNKLALPGSDDFNLTAQSLGLRGRFRVEHWRNSKRIDLRHFDNGITNEGKNFLFNAMFHSGTQNSTWYLGLITATGYSALAATDTYANIGTGSNGWSESTVYTDPANSDSASTRPTWTPGSASGQSITNSSVVVFDITGTDTIEGILICGGANAQTKSDHTAAASNVLWSTALFSGGTSSVLNGDQLKVTYTVSA